MKRAHILLAAILVFIIGHAFLYESLFWIWFPDDVAPDGVQFIARYGYLVALPVLLFLWCWVDAADRRIKVSLGVPVFVSLLFPIGVPYYFLRTYPRNRALVQTGWFIAFVAICVATLRISGRAAYIYFATIL